MEAHYWVSWERREERAKHSWVVGEVSHEEGVSRKVGDVPEHGKSRQAWKSSAHVKIHEWPG